MSESEWKKEVELLQKVVGVLQKENYDLKMQLQVF
jgi:hypothetical protein